MILDPVIYPHRHWVKAGECGRQPIKDMETWVKGGTFHRYGIKAWDRGPTLEEALERCRENPAVLKIEGELDCHGHVSYWIYSVQTGDPDSRGYSGPHMTPEDACFNALSYIEEHEREVYVENLVVGLA